METLTERQESILTFITAFLEKRRIPPSIREIQEHFGFESTNAVNDHLSQLERKGFLKRHRGISRGIELLGRTLSPDPAVARIPLVGQIAAGSPILAEENIEGYYHLDRTLVPGAAGAGLPPPCFLLRIQGDSMKGAGIHSRDLVLVKKQERAERGEIVAAYWDGEATVKYFYPKPGSIELRPANTAYKPIRISGPKRRDFRILGKVKAVLRIF